MGGASNDVRTRSRALSIIIFIYMVGIKILDLLASILVSFDCSPNKRIFKGPGCVVRGLDFIKVLKAACEELVSRGPLVASRGLPCLPVASRGLSWPLVASRGMSWPLVASRGLS